MQTEPELGQLPYLDTFTQAAELGSFTAAARMLGLTQAAVSQRIQALEKALGTSLFQRHGGRAMLTEAGRRLHPFAQQISDLHRQARAEISGYRAPIAGELALAASSIPGEHLLPALLAEYRRRFPAIQVRAAITDSAAVMQQVEHGEVHIGLVGQSNNNPHLEFCRFATDRMVLVVSPDHPLARRKKAGLKQIATQPLILRETGSGVRHFFEAALTQVGKSLRDLHIVMELGSNEAIKEAVARNLGIAMLSAYAVQKEVKAGMLHALPVSDLSCDRKMFIVWDRRRVLPIPARAFRILVQSQSITAPDL